MRNLSWAIIFLVIFLLFTGLMAVTNFRFVWMGTLAGISAILSAVAFMFGK